MLYHFVDITTYLQTLKGAHDPNHAPYRTPYNTTVTICLSCTISKIQYDICQNLHNFPTPRVTATASISVVFFSQTPPNLVTVWASYQWLTLFFFTFLFFAIFPLQGMMVLNTLRLGAKCSEILGFHDGQHVFLLLLKFKEVKSYVKSKQISTVRDWRSTLHN